MGKPKKPEAPEKIKKQADALEAIRRVDEILKKRLDGAQYHDVAEHAEANGWGIKERQIREYIQKADKIIARRSDRNRRQIIARHIAQRQSLFTRAIKESDLRTALAILDSEAKLRGLFPDKGLKELVKLAVMQSKQIAELKGRLDAHAGGSSSSKVPEKCSGTGATGEGGSTEGGGSSGGVPS